jgi:hypothetical protein
MKQRQGSHLASVENPSMLHLQVGNMKTQNTYVHSLMSNIFYINVNSCQYDFVKRFKNYVSGVLYEVKTRFTPNISRESINAAPAGRDHENTEYICTFIKK